MISLVLYGLIFLLHSAYDGTGDEFAYHDSLRVAKQLVSPSISSGLLVFFLVFNPPRNSNVPFNTFTYRVIE